MCSPGDKKCTCRTVPDVVVGFFLDVQGCELHDHRHQFKWKTPTHMECYCGAGKRVIA